MEIDGHTSGRDEIVERGAKVYSISRGRENKYRRDERKKKGEHKNMRTDR
jgi:hypothetical protein